MPKPDKLQRQIQRAMAAQDAIVKSGDNDLWQQACEIEGAAAHRLIQQRIAAGKAPLATAWGLVAQAVILMRMYVAEDKREAAVAQGTDFFYRGIVLGEGQPDPKAH